MTQNASLFTLSQRAV